MKCPKCGSTNLETMDYIGKECVMCKDCGFDECLLYDVYPEQRTSKSSKVKQTPYRRGGPRRAQK